jgi:hypothetical protein
MIPSTPTARLYHALIAYPDSAKEYFKAVEKPYDRAYQAVHDILHVMSQEGVLTYENVEEQIGAADVRDYVPTDFFNLVLFADSTAHEAQILALIERRCGIRIK